MIRALLLLTLLASPAWGNEADAIAGAAAATAYDVHTTYCADIATSDSNVQVAQRTAIVTNAWTDTLEAYDQTGRSYLKYWTGVLSACLNQEERAARDLQLFVYLEQLNPDFQGLVKDAKTRLRRMQIEIEGPTDVEMEAAKKAREAGGDYSLAENAKALQAASLRTKQARRFLINVGSGYQRTGRYNYVPFGVHLSGRLAKFLRLEGAVQAGVSLSRTGDDGGVEPTARYMLLTGGIGVGFEFPGPVHPRVGIQFHGAPNPSGIGDLPFLPGVNVHGGVDIPLGTEVVALRPFVEVGNLGPLMTFRGGIGVTVGIGQ